MQNEGAGGWERQNGLRTFETLMRGKRIELSHHPTPTSDPQLCHCSTTHVIKEQLFKSLRAIITIPSLVILRRVLLPATHTSTWGWGETLTSGASNGGGGLPFLRPLIIMYGILLSGNWCARPRRWFCSLCTSYRGKLGGCVTLLFAYSWKEFVLIKYSPSRAPGDRNKEISKLLLFGSVLLLVKETLHSQTHWEGNKSFAHFCKYTLTRAVVTGGKQEATAD